MSARTSARRSAASATMQQHAATIAIKTEPQQRKRVREPAAAQNLPVAEEAGPAPNNRRRVGVDPEIAKMQAKITAYDREARSKLGRFHVPQERLDAAVAAVVRFMLFKQTEHPNIPVPAKLLNDVIKTQFTHTLKPGTSTIVIGLAQAKMARVFGLEMQEISSGGASTSRSAQGKDDGGGAKSYVLKSLLPTSYREKFLADLPNKPMPVEHQALLTMILHLLEGHGGMVPEEELWHELTAVGVVSKDAEHPALGRPADVLDAFIKQKFLKRIKIPGGVDGPEWGLEKGDHADNHFVPSELKDHLKELLNLPGAQATQS